MSSRDIASPLLVKDSQAHTSAPALEERDNAHDREQEHVFEWAELARIAFVAIAAAAVWFGVWEPVQRVSVLGVIGLLVGGWPIFKEAFENLISRRMTMELSMTIAIIAAAAIGEFFTALVIALFVLVAEVLEGMTVSRGRRARAASSGKTLLEPSGWTQSASCLLAWVS
jgi:cation transport ATPase